MKIGYICKLCSKQWGDWSSDSRRDLSVCSGCDSISRDNDKVRKKLLKLSKDELISRLISTQADVAPRQKSGVQTKCSHCRGRGLEIHEGAPGCPVEENCGNCNGTGWCDG